MKANKIYTIATICILIIITTFIATQFLIKPKKIKYKLSGAGKALDAFCMQRALEDSIIPHQLYSKAYEKHQEMQLLSKKKDDVQWEAIGPKNFAGRMIGLAFNPQNPNTILAGSASGGLWKTTTDGIGVEAWKYVHTGFPVLGVMGIAVNPLDSNEIYIGTGEVYRYRKSGEGIGERTSRGTYGIGLLKSTDNGISWTKVLDWQYGDMRGINDVLINPVRPNTVWAATSEGLHVSYNAGDTWELKVDAFNATDVLMHPQDTSIVFAACGNFGSANHGIYRSTNGGIDFEKISNGGNNLPTTWSGKTMLDMQLTEPYTLFASIADQFMSRGLFSSTDNGASWRKLNGVDYATYQGWFSHDVAVHPENENEVVVVGVLPYKSTDGGVTLAQTAAASAGSLNATPVGDPGPSDYCHVDIHRVMYHPTNYNKVYYVTDGGIFVSPDGGLTFETRNGSLQTQQFYADFSNSHQDSIFAIGGMQDNNTAIYEGNDSWRRVIQGDGLSTAINPLNDSIVYGSSQYLNINKSINKAQSFFPIRPPNNNNATTAFAGPYAMCQSNPNILYAGRNTIFKSENSADWNFQSEPLNGAYMLRIAVAPQNCDLLYASTGIPDFGGIALYKSDDGAQTWEKATSNLPRRFMLDIAVHPKNEDWVYVAIGAYRNKHLYKSEDGAESFKIIGAELPDVPVNTILIDTVGVDHLYIGTDIGVYVSDNDGKTWSVLQAGLPDAILAMDLSISPVNRKLRVATHGNGVYQRPLIAKKSPCNPPAAGNIDCD